LTLSYTGLGSGLEGAADFLYPFYDRPGQAAFFQIGGRTMAGNRLIANLGLGQRFFPDAATALGYNLFFDGDLGRGHGRAGLGVEIWRSYARLSANLYRPLGSFKDSPDYPGLAQERAAGGWDVRLRAYLPAYPRLSGTAAYERWGGGQIGGFREAGPDGRRPKEGRAAYAYGLSWSPVPRLTASLERGRQPGGGQAVSASLAFNLISGERGGTPSGEGLAEGPSLMGSRHDFPERRYDMPLSYRAKEGYVISLVGREGERWAFRVMRAGGGPASYERVGLIPMSQGFSVLGPGDLPIDSALTDGEGYLRAVFRPQAGVERGRVALSIGGARAEFALAWPSGGAGRGIFVLYLGEVEDNVHLFRVVDGEGRPVPGRDVSVSTGQSGVPVADPDDSQPRAVFRSDRDGYFRVRLVPAGGLSETEASLVPEGESQGDDYILPLRYQLALSASPLALDYLQPQEVTFRVSLNGEPLEAGAEVSLVSEGGLVSGIPGHPLAVGPGGEISLALTAQAREGQAPVRALAFGKESNAVTFLLGASGGFGLSASPQSLEFLTPAPVDLFFDYRGTPLPAGVPVSLYATGGDFSGLPAGAVTQAGGRVSLPALDARRLSGPLHIRGEVAGALTNPVPMAVTSQPGGFSLAASPDELELYAPTEAALSLYYRGSSLPAGIEAEILGDISRFEGLPERAVTEAGGRITLPSLTAVWPEGPLELKARIGGSLTDSAFVGVRASQAAFAALFSLSPRLNGLVGDPLYQGPLIKPCLAFSLSLELSYLGRPLAGVPLSLTGFKFSESGKPLVTDALGRISGTVYYDSSDLGAYQADPLYRFFLGGQEISREGPLPVNFDACL
jgi:hypothetical protein